MIDEAIDPVNFGECGFPRQAVCDVFGCHLCCPTNYEYEEDKNGNSGYVRKNILPWKEVEPKISHIECGNCGTSRRMIDNHLVEQCTGCKDEEYDLNEMDLPF